MPTDGMTPEQAIRWAGTLSREPRETWPEQLRSLRLADFRAAIDSVRNEPPVGDAQRALLVRAFQANAARENRNVAARPGRSKRPALKQVMTRFRVGERAAYRLLAEHDAPKHGREYVLDNATWARIAHHVTTRVLRSLVVSQRAPQTQRELRSAQEYARRLIPPIRPEPLTGAALDQAILSLEAADPSLVRREHREP